MEPIADVLFDHSASLIAWNVHRMSPSQSNFALQLRQMCHCSYNSGGMLARRLTPLDLNTILSHDIRLPICPHLRETRRGAPESAAAREQPQ